MMERAEKTGFAVALVGHAALVALLSLHLMAPTPPVVPPQQAIEVSLAPDVALQQAAPPAPTPPAPSEAPEQGAPEEAAAPPAATPPAPEPKPAPPQPAPPPPAPPRPTPPKPAPAQPKPAPPKSAPPKPIPPKPAEPKPAPAKPTLAKPAPAKPVTRANPDRLAAVAAAAERAEAERAAAAAAARAARADAARTAAAEKAQAAKAALAAKADAAKAAVAAKRARGSRLGNDFLKGLADTPAKAPPSAAAPGAVMNAKAAADIGSAILRQVQPCADRQVIPGPGAERIRVSINLKLNRDGSLAAPPRIVNHDGIDADNRRYLDRVDDLAVATFTGCSPLRGLPPGLYDVPNGWRSFTLRFNLRG